MSLCLCASVPLWQYNFLILKIQEIILILVLFYLKVNRTLLKIEFSKTDLLGVTYERCIRKTHCIRILRKRKQFRIYVNSFIVKYTHMRFLKKILLWFVIVIATIIALLYLFKVDYLLKAVRTIYLNGHTTAFLKDYTEFDNRTVHRGRDRDAGADHVHPRHRALAAACDGLQGLTPVPQDITCSSRSTCSTART